MDKYHRDVLVTYHWDFVGCFIWDLFETSWRPTDGTSSLHPHETSSQHTNKMLWKWTNETSWQHSTETLLGVLFETYLWRRWGRTERTLRHDALLPSGNHAKTSVNKLIAQKSVWDSGSKISIFVKEYKPNKKQK